MKQLICLCAALLVLATACCKNEAPKDKSALEVIKARTSIRSFTGEKLTEQQIHTLLDAAMAAPRPSTWAPSGSPATHPNASSTASEPISASPRT